MIALRYQEYYVTGLPKDFRIISPEHIHTSEEYKVKFIAHWYDDYDSYTYLNLREDKPNWEKEKPVEGLNKLLPKKQPSRSQSFST